MVLVELLWEAEGMTPGALETPSEMCSFPPAQDLSTCLGASRGPASPLRSFQLRHARPPGAG